MSVVEVKDLKKTYRELRALDGISFDVKEGEILGLLGPNGSGKSTTIGCILSLLRFDSGSIRIFGKEMSPTAYDLKKRIGIVFQEVAVFDELTVRENINYFCGLYIRNRKQRSQYVDQAMQMTGLENFSKFYPKQLSGGLLRRLNIACGIAHKPDLIILDEPTVAVDPQSREAILEGIRKLNAEGVSIIYTSHYMEEVEELCDRIIILDAGKVLASGTKEELKQRVSLKEKVTIVGIDADEELLEEIRRQENLKSLEQNERVLHLTYTAGEGGIGRLAVMLESRGIRYDSIFSEQPSLNDVFLELTGKELRD